MRDWTTLRPLVESTARARSHVLSNAALVHRLDQAGASIRDALDAIGIAAADPDELHTGITFLRLMIHNSAAAETLGMVRQGTTQDVCRLARGLVVEFLDLLPAEAGARHASP